MTKRVTLLLLAPALLACAENGETLNEETEHRHGNRLAKESSPYLLQHAGNPVDWFPWGEEAFAKAREEGKPVFLSIGYSTCHWCHVMERESFESEEIAGILNELFVAIKVDREERPDVDNVYMAAVQAMTGHGGWPLSVFLTPEGKPFYGGTYFPPEDRYGRPGFRSVLLQIAAAWRDKRDEVEASAERLTSHVADLSVTVGSASVTEATLAAGVGQFEERFDSRHGGFESAPKFPRTHALSFLLRQHDRTGDGQVLAMVEKTLASMWRGGMYDHLGGGFHRYSTDPVWLVPHFEKMLYDQALAARAYVEAYQLTGEPRYAAVARDVFRYVLRDMTDGRGGFYSAEDADSEGVEGKFYVWTKAEVVEVLGAGDGELFARVYGIREEGNFRDEATGRRTGGNILHLVAPLADAARDAGVPVDELESRLAPMRERLFAAREGRVRPLKDDKVLTDWNGLMIGSLAYAGRALDEPRYVDAARRAAEFLLETMVADGRLLHRYRDGKASIPAFLDDHAFLALGLLDLYEATFEARWLAEAKRLAGETIRLFGDEEAGGFLFSGRDGEALVSRTKEVYDGAIPSGNSAAALALLRIGRLTGDAGLESKGRETVDAFSAQLDRMPSGFPFMLMALDFAVGPTREIALAGDPDEVGLRDLRRVVDRRFLPRSVLAFRPSHGADEAVALVPFLEHQAPVEGAATAYVCRDYACERPVTTPEDLAELLGVRR